MLKKLLVVVVNQVILRSGKESVVLEGLWGYWVVPEKKKELC